MFSPAIKDMKIPAPILQYLTTNRIVAPTPIQLQGIPAAYVRLFARLLSVTFRPDFRVVILLASPSLDLGKLLPFVFP